MESAERAKRGLKDGGTAVIIEQTKRRSRRELRNLTDHSEGSIIDSGPSWSVFVVNRRLFGDESDLHFWTVASHYLQSFAQARQLSVSTAEGQAQSEATQPPAQNHLDICHDVLCESSYFQVSETAEDDSVSLLLLLLLSFCDKRKQKRQIGSQHLKIPLGLLQRQFLPSRQNMHKFQQHRSSHTVHSIILTSQSYSHISERSNQSLTSPSPHWIPPTFPLLNSGLWRHMLI